MSCSAVMLASFRHASRTAPPRVRTIAKPLATSRAFSISTARSADSQTDKVATEEYSGGEDNKHATDKKDKLDVQSANSAEARESKAKDTGGGAVRQKDERNSKQKAKEEFPEAPTTIGMQDERGGKGV